MFCPNCGTKIEGNIRFCGNCGTALNTEQIKEHSATENTVNAYGNNGSSYNPGMSPTVNSVALPKIRINKKLVPVIAAAVLVLAVVIGVASYFNSPSYKIKKSTILILSGDYTGVSNVLRDVFTEQANAIIDFVDVEKAKDKFINTAVGDDIKDTTEAYWDFDSKLKKFENKDEYELLPDELKAQYNCYKSAFEYVTVFLESKDRKLTRVLYDVQTVMMNEVDRNNSSKNGDTFTLKQLQARVDKSSEAIKTLKGQDFTCIEIDNSNVLAYCHTTNCKDTDGNDMKVIYLSYYLQGTLITLIKECEEEISSSQSRINSSAEEFDMDDELYKTSPISGYSSYVGDNLLEIDDYNDIGNNEAIMLNLFRRDILYYLIEGEIISA